MNIRNLDENDLCVLQDIHDDSFPFPELNNPLYFIQKVVEENGIVKAAGIVRLTSEGMVIIDKTLTRIKRAEMVRSLILACMVEAKSRGMDECHLFVREPNMKQFLYHLGFFDSKGGDVLVTHL